MSLETRSVRNIETDNERRADTIRPVLDDLTRLRESADQIESLYGHVLGETLDTLSDVLREELNYLQNPTANHEPMLNQEAQDALLRALSGLDKKHFNN